MDLLSNLTFTTPWMLAATAVLPVLWWLLRVTPPAPKMVTFPSLLLLQGLDTAANTAAKTPWWVLLLRALIVLLLIIGLSGPLVNPQRALPGNGPLALVVETGWTVSTVWTERLAALRAVVARAGREDRLIHATDTTGAIPPALYHPEDLNGLLDDLSPQPWAGDLSAATALLSAQDPAMPVFWFGSGVREAGQDDWLDQLATHPLRRIVFPPSERFALLAEAVQQDGGGVGVRLIRATDTAAQRLTLRATGRAGQVLHTQDVTLDAGAYETTVTLDLPQQVRNRIARLDVQGVASAGTTVLLDNRWQRRRIALPAGGPQTEGFLDDTFYLRRALSPFHDLVTGALSDALEADPPPDVVLLPDGWIATEAVEKALTDWLDAGGLIIRLAGPQMATTLAEGARIPFLPTPLRRSERTLGGALSWTEPQALAPFPDDSPFAALPLSSSLALSRADDITISRQVLAQPGTAAAVWARLQDGTPLVTARDMGQGRVVLFHTAALPEWSTLSLSGLFVDMLNGVVRLAGNRATGTDTALLMPWQVLDGFGQLRDPAGDVRPVRLMDWAPSRETPPGLYGDNGQRRAANLSDHITDVQVAALPDTWAVWADEDFQQEKPVGGWLIALAALLFALDTLVTLFLRGHLSLTSLRPAATTALVLALLLPPLLATPAQADLPEDIAFGTWLAYVETGDPLIDEMSHAGLEGLSKILDQRTSVEARGAVGINPDVDELAFFPLIYWPWTPTARPVTLQALQRLDAYMQNGGTIVFDTRNAGADNDTHRAFFQSLTRHMRIPPLVPVPRDHVLTKAFYLLQDFPGRYNGETVWVAAPDANTNDGVSPVIVGGNDWAAAWAIDTEGRPTVPFIAGGERQREMAYRVGVNMVMYVLTGNYKADQVHVKHILERIGE